MRTNLSGFNDRGRTYCTVSRRTSSRLHWQCTDWDPLVESRRRRMTCEPRAEKRGGGGGLEKGRTISIGKETNVSRNVHVVQPR